MDYKILAAKWWTPRMSLIGIRENTCIGAVAIESFIDGSWKVYIGYGLGENEGEDCQRITAWGSPIGNKEAACGLFPQLDPNKFKY